MAKPKPHLDPELAAMRDVLIVLAPFNRETKLRILAWATERTRLLREDAPRSDSRAAIYKWLAELTKDA